MDLSQMVNTGVAAVAGLTGVLLGSRLSRRAARDAWEREQRVSAFAPLLKAVDRQSTAFTLLSARLGLVDYEPGALRPDSLDGPLEAWGDADRSLEEALPVAALVASEDAEIVVSIQARLGMRTRQRILLMQLEQQGSVDADEWRHVTEMTALEADHIQRALRQDLQGRASTGARTRIRHFFGRYRD